MRVLISDPASNDAVSYLENNGINVDLKPTISKEELYSIIENYDVLLVRSRTKVTEKLIQKGKKLLVIGRIGSGFDNIDIDFCKTRKITVINAPDANSQSVAELTIILIISLLRKTEMAFNSMRKGKWLKNEIWGTELYGKTVGILGYGYVGIKVAELLKALHCKLLIYSLNYNNCTLDELFSKSDIVTLHVTLNSKTRGMVSGNLMSKMKKSAYLVNLSRGEIINENDLYNLLTNGKIAGAALDVFWQEPLPPDSRWRKLDNVLLTPHLGAATKDALDRASMTVAEDIINIKNGKKPKFEVK